MGSRIMHSFPQGIFGILLVIEVGRHFIDAAAVFNCTQPPNLGNFDVNSCCRMPDINLTSVLARCEKYVSELNLSKDQDTYPFYVHACYAECVYREAGVLTDTSIQVENVKKFLHKNVNAQDREVIPEIVRSFDTCVAHIKQHLDGAGLRNYRPLLAGIGCSPYSISIYGCVNAEIFIHCPSQMWRKGDRNCQLAKDFAEQCNPLPHVPLPAV